MSTGSAVFNFNSRRRGFRAQIHYFSSSVAPQGPVPVDEWVAYWRELHAGFNASGARWDSGLWDAFMANSQVCVGASTTTTTTNIRLRLLTLTPYDYYKQ